MTDLHDLLDQASGAESQPTPVADDLARARTALRRRRVGRTGVASVAAAAVIAGAFGVSSLAGTSAEPGGREIANGPSTSTAPANASDIKLVASELEAGPYIFGKVPEGWAVQGEDPVVIAPTDGSVSDEPYDFQGKLLISYELNPVGPGEKVTWGGTTYTVRGDSGYRSIVRPTSGDEPDGIVVVQYPDKEWTQELMLEFAAAVKVTDRATAGVG